MSICHILTCTQDLEFEVLFNMMSTMFGKYEFLSCHSALLASSGLLDCQSSSLVIA